MALHAQPHGLCICVCVCIYIYIYIYPHSWFAVSSGDKLKFGWSLLSSTPLNPLSPLKYISQHVCIIAYMPVLLAWLVFQDLLSLFALESISGEYEQMTSEYSTSWLLLLIFRLGSKFCIDHTEVNQKSYYNLIITVTNCESENRDMWL